jgi:hypothetical protein
MVAATNRENPTPARGSMSRAGGADVGALSVRRPGSLASNES